MRVEKIKRTTSSDKDFLNLVFHLDKDLLARYPEEHSFYSQYNKTALIKNVVVFYVDGVAAGCGAFKEFDKNIVEIKRMFVKHEFRKRGIALAILKELEQWATELNYNGFILETGTRQHEAIALYQKAGYSVIPNYGQYQNMETSVCMKKMI